MNHPDSFSLGIIGSGPSAIYLLKHLLDHLDRLVPALGRISIFERSEIMGMGMPYSPEMSDIHNLSNISSEELPDLVTTFAGWLRRQSASTLADIGVIGEINVSEVYPRIALGRYLQAQYRSLLDLLSEAGIRINEFSGCTISDILAGHPVPQVTLVTDTGSKHTFDRVVLATGHCWPHQDQPARGYYGSPWPIHKLLPNEGNHFNFTIGTLGASLSAFDVISSLAHRHGKFAEDGSDGKTRFIPHAGTEDFHVVMHSSEGLLPHLQFAQEKPMREIYRHVSREELLDLIDAKGFLRLEHYFDKVCRPTLITAFEKGRMQEMVRRLQEPGFSFLDFIDEMTDRHAYSDAFEVMRNEMVEARKSVLNEQPIHWKEYMDDLIYTLNFHAELMPAEDHQMLSKEVMPFLMNVIAAMPLPSGRKILALHEAGKLSIMPGKVEIADEQPNADTTRVLVTEGGRTSSMDYKMFVDCSGQKRLEIEDYPFQSLVRGGVIRQAKAAFADDDSPNALSADPSPGVTATDSKGRPLCLIGGLDIDPFYRVKGADGKPNPVIHEISFPLTSGLRPYSYGLQACSETARILVAGWIAHA